MTLMPATSRLILYAGIAGAAAAILTPHHASAGSFYLQDQSVRGLGRAYSGEVADSGVESLWWNPAAIAGSGRELYLGEHTVLTSSKVLDQGSTITRPIPPAGLTTPVGGDPRAYKPILFGIIPNGGFSIPLGDRFSVGLLVAAPYDFTSKYSATSFARYGGIKSRLTTIDLQPSVAMRVAPWLDLGAALNAEYTSANLTGALPNLSPLLPDGYQSLRGDGWNYGYSVGARMHFGALDLGLSYKSAMDHDIDGTVSIQGLAAPLTAANVTTDGSGHFTTPWMATLGARYRLTPRLTLNGQVQRQGWSEFKAITVNYAGQTQVTPENYRDVTTGAVGVDYAVKPTWTLRAGVAYDPTPTNPAYRDTRVPDSDRWLYTVGTSAQVTPRMTLDAGFAYVQFNGSTVTATETFYGGTPAATAVNERATSSGNAKVLSVGMRYSF